MAAWAGDALGTAIADARLISGGNRHGTWTLTPVSGPDVVLRVSGDQADDHLAGPSPLRREAAAYTAVAGTGLPAPRLLAEGRVGRADVLLVTLLPGDAALPPPGDARDAVGADLMRQVAALHRMDVRELDLGLLAATGPGALADRRAWVQHDVASWEARYRLADALDPLIEHALAWCRSEVPGDDRPPVLVHGDIGPGNFLHDGSHVTGLVDWELAHLGDPLDDLAGFALRTVHTRMDGFRELIAAYEAAGGEEVDPQRLAYHQVLAALRVTILRHVAPAVEADVKQANRMISRILHRRLLLEALHHAGGRHVPAPVPVPQRRTPLTGLYDAVTSLLRHDVLPHCDEAGAEATKVVARLVKHLAAHDAQGAAADTAVREALTPLAGVGGPPSAATPLQEICTDVAARIRDGSLGEEVRPWLAVLVGWETELMRPAMGVLADRPLPTTGPTTTTPAGATS